MKKLNVLAIVFLAGLVIAGCSQKELINTDDEVSLSLKSASVAGKYIVVLNEDANISSANAQSRIDKVKAKAYGLLKKNDISENVEEVYGTALQGFAVKMAPGQAKKLREDSNIKFIEPDQVVALSPIEMNGKPGGGGSSKPGGGSTQPPQTTPWGITRVGGGTITPSGTAWIIDTGIDFAHPDLQSLVDTKRSKTYVSRTSSANDDNGHGSHVAGIIAALDNGIGVIGVAPGAQLVAVKVLDRNGSGSYSAVIAGVDYVAANGKIGDVVNMSLGGPPSDALDAAVLNASTPTSSKPDFVKFALAAGNETDYASNHSPARVNGPNIYTISAMNSYNNWASWSNFSDANSVNNSPIDFCAPGVSIYSTYKGGGYATLSGTSMAAPHVAGLLLIGAILSDGTVIGDPKAPSDPIAHH